MINFKRLPEQKSTRVEIPRLRPPSSLRVKLHVLATCLFGF